MIEAIVPSVYDMASDNVTGTVGNFFFERNNRASIVIIEINENANPTSTRSNAEYAKIAKP